MTAQPNSAIWWAPPVECMSALARKEREGRLSLAASKEGFAVITPGDA
ncbi:MAG: hypothetical protein R6U56_02985 [Opitutales bacterium]